MWGRDWDPISTRIFQAKTCCCFFLPFCHLQKFSHLLKPTVPPRTAVIPIILLQDKYHVYFLTEFLGGGDLFYAIRLIGVWDAQWFRPFFADLSTCDSDFLLNFEAWYYSSLRIHGDWYIYIPIFRYNKNQLNVGKYIIHGRYGMVWVWDGFISVRISILSKTLVGWFISRTLAILTCNKGILRNRGKDP